MKKKSQLIIISIVGLSIGLLAVVLLSDNNIDDWTMKITGNDSSYSIETTYDEDKVDESFGIGLYDAPVHISNHSLHHSATINENQSLTAYLWVSNQMTSENDFLVFLLSDYEQVPFIFGDERKKEILHSIHLEPFEEDFFRFEIDPLTRGEHDVEIVLVMRPYEHSLEKSFRRSTDFSYLGSKRLSIFVDSEDYPTVTYANSSVLSSVPCNPDYPINDGLLITRTPCSTTGWFTEDVTPGERLDYWINAAADEDYPVTFALIPFVDFVQVPLRVDDSVSTIFCSLKAGEKISLPASIIVPEEEGVHELFVLWVPAPYQQMEVSEGISRDIGQWPWSEPSVRIGLNVSGV